jgi:hypothetical protein
MLKVCHPSMRDMLDEIVPFFGKTVKLFQNNVTVTRDTTLSAFVEADFDGYTPATPTWVAAVQNGAQDVSLANPITWTAGAGLVTPQTIYGYFCLDNVGNYSWGETFPDGPVTIAVVGQQLKLYPQFASKNFGE